jgi:hypothetical protein
MNENYSISNNGRLFEIYVAEKLKGEHDGRVGMPDVTANGKVYECKFYTRSIQKRVSSSGKDFPKGAKQAVYNYSNGCKLSSKNVRANIESYCKGFDFLVVGTGESGDKPDTFEIMTTTDALEWLIKRTYAKGADAIRFGYESGTTKAGGDERRKNTLNKNGFKGIA